MNILENVGLTNEIKLSPANTTKFYCLKLVLNQNYTNDCKSTFYLKMKHY